MKTLKGSRIWLIGASFGIGAELARALSQSGAQLVLSARSGEALQKVAASCEGKCEVVLCDVTDHTQITQAHAQALEAFGGLDKVIYNVGTYEPTSCANFHMDAVMHMIDTNLHGAIRVLHTILPDMQRQQSGHIVLVGSVAGYRGLPKAMGYGLSKAALIHLAENLRQDLEGSGIEVSIINPGFVKTRLTEKNEFDMPAEIEPAQAARYIVAGLQRGQYEIHFPKRFTYVMKAMSLLPSRLYFWLCSKLL